MDAKDTMALAAQLHEEMSPMLMNAIVSLLDNQAAKVVMTCGDVRGKAHASITVCIDEATTRGIADLILPGQVDAQDVN